MRIRREANYPLDSVKELAKSIDLTNLSHQNVYAGIVRKNWPKAVFEAQEQEKKQQAYHWLQNQGKKGHRFGLKENWLIQPLDLIRRDEDKTSVGQGSTQVISYLGVDSDADPQGSHKHQGTQRSHDGLGGKILMAHVAGSEGDQLWSPPFATKH